MPYHELWAAWRALQAEHAAARLRDVYTLRLARLDKDQLVPHLEREEHAAFPEEAD